MVKDMGNQFPISKGVELVQCLWLLLLKVCSYFHKIEEDNFVAQWRTVNQNWDIHSEIVEENKVFYTIMLIQNMRDGLLTLDCGGKVVARFLSFLANKLRGIFLQIIYS